METFYLMKSTIPTKKYTVFFTDENGKMKKISFGAIKPDGTPYTDYTTNKNPIKRIKYITSHSKMGEDWTKNGRYTRGFWSRWLLWEHPNIKDAIKAMENRFNIKINFL
jgi:hypothetical protein